MPWDVTSLLTRGRLHLSEDDSIVLDPGETLQISDASYNDPRVQLALGANQISAVQSGTREGVDSNIQVEDVDVTSINPVPVTGSFTISGPIEVIQTIHDDLNANANIQVGDADVSVSNPVPVTGTLVVTGPTEVIQDTHDDLNANANIQVGDVDVGTSNPVPVSSCDSAGDVVDFGGLSQVLVEDMTASQILLDILSELRILTTHIKLLTEEDVGPLDI